MFTRKSMLKQKSITIKIAVPIIFVVFLVLTSLSAYMLNHAWENSKTMAYEKTEALGTSFANEMKGDIQKSLSISKSMARTLLSLKNSEVTDREFVVKYTHDILMDNQNLIGTWAIFEANAWDGEDQRFINQGSYHDSTGRFIPYNAIEGGKIVTSPLLEYEVPGAGDYFLVPKKRMKDTLIEPYLYKIGSEMVMMTSAVVPIILDGKFIGATGVDLPLKSVQEKVNRIKPYATSVSYLLSSEEYFVTNPDADLITKKFSMAGDPKFKKVFHENQTLSLVINEKGKDYLYTAVPFTIGDTEQHWTLLVKTPMSTIMADARGMLVNQVLISLVGLLFLLGLIYLIASNLTKTLNKIIKGLKEESEIVNSNSRHVAEASERISSANTQQASSLQETVSSVEEISAMVARNADSANESVKKSEASTQAALKGKEKSWKVIEAIHSIEDGNQKLIEQLNQANEKMSDIVVVIQNIANKTEVINDIVFQTKLLSFNASVEAARAGENGKGFAVVAEEVGNLASMSGNAAKEISELVNSSVSQVSETVEYMKNLIQQMMMDSKSKVKVGIETSEECNAVLEEILQNVSLVNDLIKNISSASNEQALGIQEINKAMNELDQVTQSSMAVANETSSTAAELMAQSGRLNSLVSELNKLATGTDQQSVKLIA